MRSELIHHPLHFQETDTLCSSIFATQKLNKSIRKMKTNLEEILETQRVLLETKAAEKVCRAWKDVLKICNH